MSGPLEELRGWLESIRLASSGEIVLAIQPFGTVAPFTIRLNDLDALLAASGTGERPADEGAFFITLACGHRARIGDDENQPSTRAEATEFVILCVATGDTVRCPDDPSHGQQRMIALAPTPPDAGTGTPSDELVAWLSDKDAAWVYETALTEWAAGEEEQADEREDDDPEGAATLRANAAIARAFAASTPAAPSGTTGATTGDKS